MFSHLVTFDDSVFVSLFYPTTNLLTFENDKLLFSTRISPLLWFQPPKSFRISQAF